MMKQTESFYQTSQLFSKAECSNSQTLFDIICDHELLLIFLPDSTSKFSVDRLEEIQKNQKELLKLNVVPVVIFVKGDSKELVYWFQKLLTKVIYVTKSQDALITRYETKEGCCSIYHIRELVTIKSLHYSEEDSNIDFKLFTINPQEKLKKSKYRSVVIGRTKRDTQTRFSYAYNFELTEAIEPKKELTIDKEKGKLINQMKRKSQQERQEKSNNEEKVITTIKRRSQKLIKAITPQYDSSISRSSNKCDDDDEATQLDKKLSSVKLKDMKKLTLDEILNDSVFFDFMKAFAALEYSSESFIFYQEVKNFKELTQFEERVQFVEDAVLIFLTPNSDSVLELNISHLDFENFNEKFQKQKENKKIEDDLFDGLVKTIVKYSIEDTYTRFILSDLYKQMMSINLSS